VNSALLKVVAAGVQINVPTVMRHSSQHSA